MARPPKTGLDFFPFPVDFFEQDAIQFLSVRASIKAEAIAVRLMCRIYKNGYATEFNNDIAKLFARSVGDSNLHGLVNDVVHELLRRGFFDEGIFKQFGILTSFEIQSTYQRICTDAKRKDWKIDEKINLLRSNSGITPEKSGINPEETGKNSVDNTQSKEKESKEKEIILSQDKPAPDETKDVEAGGIIQPVVDIPPAPPSPPEPPKTPPKKNKEKSSAKKESRPFWDVYLQTFSSVYSGKNKGEVFELSDRDFPTMANIYDLLVKRAKRKGKEWTEDYMVDSFTFFLTQSFGYLKQFSIASLFHQFNNIYNATAQQHGSGSAANQVNGVGRGIIFD